MVLDCVTIGEQFRDQTYFWKGQLLVFWLLQLKCSTVRNFILLVVLDKTNNFIWSTEELSEWFFFQPIVLVKISPYIHALSICLIRQGGMAWLMTFEMSIGESFSVWESVGQLDIVFFIFIFKYTVYMLKCLSSLPVLTGSLWKSKLKSASPLLDN